MECFVKTNRAAMSWDCACPVCGKLFIKPCTFIVHFYTKHIIASNTIEDTPDYFGELWLIPVKKKNQESFVDFADKAPKIPEIYLKFLKNIFLLKKGLFENVIFPAFYFKDAPA